MTDKKTVLDRLPLPQMVKELIPKGKPTGNNEWLGHCPFHDDSIPSLSVSLETGAFNCFACGAKGKDPIELCMKVWGTDFKATMRALERRAGIELKVKQQVTGRYEYHDKDGKLLYWKERVEPGRGGRSKEFFFYHGNRVSGRGCDPVLYHLPDVLKAKAIIITEGEKHADLLKTWGLTASTLDSGAQGKPTTNMVELLSGKRIVILQDNDNAGLSYALNIASALHGKCESLRIAPLPGLPDKGDICDWIQEPGNDKARLLKIIKATPGYIPPRTKPKPEEHQGRDNSQLDAAIQRLAALPPLEYDQVRKAEAKALSVRPGTLDAEVKAARKGDANGGLPFIEVEPWQEAVDPARLLSDIALTIRRFIICTEEISHAVALWAAMTWFIDDVQVAPLAVITAPEKRCGKTLLLNLLEKLSARAITASSISPAALFRTIDAWKPTLLIDEADAFMKDNEELRGLLNSGHTRDSAYVIRTVGEKFTPTRFNTWGAKALAGIGHVADTLMDRAVILELRRKLSHEKVERIRYAEPSLFNDLRSKLARFAEDCSEHVRKARPPLPHSLNDRAQDNWEPLLAIAMTASDEWLQIGTTAALKLSGGESASQTIGVELLSDIQEIFEEKQVDRISTADIIKSLCEDDEKPWATYNKGFPIKPRQIAKKLGGYGIQSKTIRIGLDTVKGYDKERFEEVFLRYIPTSPPASVTPSQSATVLSLSVTDNPQRYGCVTDRNPRNPVSVLICDRVTDKTPLLEENIFDLSEADLKEVEFL